MVYPESGGHLDQDALLMDDLVTYGWLFGLANDSLDKKEADERLAKELTHKQK